MATEPPVEFKDLPDTTTPLNADTLNTAFQGAYGNALEAEAARDLAQYYAEQAGAPADDVIAALVLSPTSATRGATDTVYVSRTGSAVNVKSYGAKGDGATDDTPAMVAAIAALPSSNRVLVIPAGTYLLSAAMDIPSNTVVVGARGATILKPTAGTTANFLLMQIVGDTDVTVTGITFDGNQAGIGNANTVVVVYQAARVVFDTCRWVNTRGAAVMFSTDVSASGVRNSSFDEVGTYQKTSGVSSDRKAAVVWTSGTKANNYGNFVTGCTFREIGLDAVSVDNQSDFLLHGNTLYSNYAGGFYGHGSSRLRFHHNHVQAQASPPTDNNGIDIAESDTVSVVGNTITGRGAGGIMVADVVNATITGNVCLNNAQNASAPHKGGITVATITTGCSNVTIAGNVCTDTQTPKTQTYGVHMTTGGTHTGIVIDASNILAGNLTANIGGGGAWSGAEWQSYTPTLVGLSGTVVGRYAIVGKTCHFTVAVTMGSVTAAACTASLPVPAASTAVSRPAGGAIATDISPSARYAGTTFILSSTTATAVFGSAYPSPTAPFTWAATDVLYFSGSYEIA